MWPKIVPGRIKRCPLITAEGSANMVHFPGFIIRPTSTECMQLIVQMQIRLSYNSKTSFILLTVKLPSSGLLTNGHLLLPGTIFGHTNLISCSWSAALLVTGE